MSNQDERYDQPGSSQQPPLTIPWIDYEALRQQHIEGMQALWDMARILQSLVPDTTLPAMLRRLMPKTALLKRTHYRDEEINSY